MRAVLIAGLLLSCIAALNAQEQVGTIVFYREPHALTGDFKPAIFCDGEELALIVNGTYLEVTAPAGLHTCIAESLQRPDAIQVNVTAGKPSYVHVRLLPGWKDHAALANTSEDEYNKQKPRLKPVKEWSRTSLGGDSVETNPSPPTKQASGKPRKDKHSGKFGDLAVHVTQLAMTPASYSKDRDELAVFVSAENTGKDVVCAELAATLNTSFGLQYRARGYIGEGFPPAPRVKEMLPGESVGGSYVFEVKDGVHPLELVIRLTSRQYSEGYSVTTIRCGSDSPLRDVFIPDEIRLDVSDLPIAPTSQ